MPAVVLPLVALIKAVDPAASAALAASAINEPRTRHLTACAVNLFSSLPVMMRLSRSRDRRATLQPKPEAAWRSDMRA